MSLHLQRYKFLWDILFERHPHGKYAEGKWQGLGDKKTDVPSDLILIEMLNKQGAGVVVFPELSLTGYGLDLAGRLAFSEGDDRFAPLLDAAALNGVTLVVGAPARLGDALHIGAFPPGAACDSCTGSVPPAEVTVFRPGDRDPLVRFGTHVAAVAVCADIGNPAHPERAAGRGRTPTWRACS